MGEEREAGIRGISKDAEEMDSRRCEGEGDLRMAPRTLAWTISGRMSHLLGCRVTEEA